MKIAFFIEGNSKNPGGYNQVLNSAVFLNYFFSKDENFIFLTNDKKLKKELYKLGIKSEQYSKNVFEKFFDFIFSLKFLLNFLMFFNLKHSFANFLKKKKIKLIFFLSPSIYASFCDDINFVINIWDVDHKKNSPFPEHKENYSYERRENFLNIVLFKSFKIIVPHEENKNDLVNFYNIPLSKIKIQTFIPYLPNIHISSDQSYENDIVKLKLQKIIKKKMILYPATFWAHKNHNFIIEAAKIMTKENLNNFHFVMTGSDRGNLNHILKLINSYNLDNYITVMPLVSNFLLKKIYEDCFAVIMPTDSGPTNLPLYEAMYFKKPIFYSNKIDTDKELKEIIFSINLSDVSSFTEKLKNINQEDIRAKVLKGSNYYNKYCNKESLYLTYKSIVDEFNLQYSKWN